MIKYSAEINCEKCGKVEIVGPSVGTRMTRADVLNDLKVKGWKTRYDKQTATCPECSAKKPKETPTEEPTVSEEITTE